MSSEQGTPLTNGTGTSGGPRLLAICAAVAGLAMLGWGFPRIPVDRSLAQLFVEGDPASRGFAEFEAAFGTDDVLLIVVEEPTGDALVPPVLQFVHELCTDLRESESVDSVQSLTELSDFDVQTHLGIRHPAPPRPWIADLGKSIDSEQRQELLTDPLLRRGLVSEDGRALAIWVMLDPALRHDPEYGRRVRSLAEDLPREVPGAPEARVLLTGAPLLHDAVLRHTWRDAGRMFAGAVICVAIALLVSGLGLQAVLGFLLVWPAVLGAMSALALGVGHSFHVFSGATAPLLLVIGSATYVHCAEARGLEPAAERRVGQRCLWATATTILAFSPLALSDLQPLRALGIELAVGAALSHAACRLVARWWLPSRPPRRPVPPRRLRTLPTTVRVALVAAALPWFLLRGPAEPSSSALTALPPDHPLVAETAAARHAIGSPAALEIVVERRSDQPAPLADVAFLRRLEELERQVFATSDGRITFSVSPLSFVRTTNVRLEDARGRDAPAAFRITDEAAAFAGFWLFGPYLGLRSDPSTPIDPAVAPLIDPMRQVLSADGSQLRLGCPIPVMSSAELLELRRRLEAEVFPEMEDALDARLVATGSSVLLAEAERAVADTQRRALALGAVLLALVFLAVARDPRAWAAAVIANAAALLTWGNLLALTNQAPDIHLTVLLATLMGVVVDDTLHLLAAWRRHEGEAGAAAAALHEVGRPIRRSSIALALAFGAFAASGLPAYRSFAWLAPAAIALALSWDLLILPRLLPRNAVVVDSAPLNDRSTS